MIKLNEIAVALNEIIPIISGSSKAEFYLYAETSGS